MRPALLAPEPQALVGQHPAVPDKLSLCYKTSPSVEAADKLCWAHAHSGQESLFLPLTYASEEVCVKDGGFLLFVALLVETVQLVSALTQTQKGSW